MKLYGEQLDFINLKRASQRSACDSHTSLAIDFLAKVLMLDCIASKFKVSIVRILLRNFGRSSVTCESQKTHTHIFYEETVRLLKIRKDNSSFRELHKEIPHSDRTGTNMSATRQNLRLNHDKHLHDDFKAPQIAHLIINEDLSMQHTHTPKCIL